MWMFRNHSKPPLLQNCAVVSIEPSKYVSVHCSLAFPLKSLRNKRPFVFLFGGEHNIFITRYRWGKGRLRFVASRGREQTIRAAQITIKRQNALGVFWHGLNTLCAFQCSMWVPSSSGCSISFRKASKGLAGIRSHRLDALSQFRNNLLLPFLC